MDDDPYANASMDRVYDRAARLVKRTLDVEEVVVMDVSHCEVLETLSAEAMISVVVVWRLAHLWLIHASSSDHRVAIECSVKRISLSARNVGQRISSTHETLDEGSFFT
ncbi:hypothetical protein EDD22DRAFT_969361 [Suillus occidentalis]|nr:hypothetical protein EDD22DRAFT_969361 [Suillus occidentalis]